MKADGNEDMIDSKALTAKRRSETSSNGEIEAVIKSVQGMTRTLNSQLGSRLNDKLKRESVLIPWMVRHAASLMSKFIVGSDGMTAYRRLKGREFRNGIAEFGECVCGTWKLSQLESTNSTADGTLVYG